MYNIKIMNVLMFIAIIDTALTLLTYIYYRSVFKWAKSWVFLVIYFLLSVNIVISRILPNTFPLIILRADAYLAGVWIGVLYFSFLIIIVHLLFMFLAYILSMHLAHVRVATYLLVIGIILNGWGAWNAFHPVVRYEQVKTNKFTDDSKLRIAMFSDMHLGRELGRGFVMDVVNLINQEKPDVVIIAGDMLDEKISYVEKDNALEAFSTLQAPFGVYMVLGNHDYFDDVERWRGLLQQRHVLVMQNENAFIWDGKVKITGLADFSHDNGNEALCRLANGNEFCFGVLADHQPKRFMAAMANGYDLCLSGHTHTGQMWPNRIVTYFMYGLDYGRKQYGKMTAIVSSGIGFWGPPIRSSTKPEIVIIDVASKFEEEDADEENVTLIDEIKQKYLEIRKMFTDVVISRKTNK